MGEKITENKKGKWKQVLQITKTPFTRRWCTMNTGSKNKPLSKGKLAKRSFIKIGMLVENLGAKCLFKLPEPILNLFIYPHQNIESQ